MRGSTLLAALLAAVLFVGAWLAVDTASAATKAERARAAAELVDEALFHELYGQDSKRSELLASALEQVPDSTAALWHTGHVRRNKRWVKFDEVPKLAAEDARLTAYRLARPKYPKTLQGRLALAEWCAKRKLVDQQRAHLTEVLEINPDHQQARRLLGYRLVDGSWLSAAEIAEAGVRARQVATGLQQWKPPLMQIREALQSRSQQRREKAMEQLREIDDPAAVPAIELVFCARDEQTALLGLETLHQIAGHEAVVALARQAVYSPWEKVRDAAVEKLKPRHKEDYVPVLLSALRSPMQSRAALYQDPLGRLVYRHAFYREGQEHGDLAVLDLLYRPVIDQSPATVDLQNQMTAGTAARLMDQADRRDALRAVQRDAVMKARARQMALARQNAVEQKLNEHVCSVLSRATGAVVAPNPRSWYEWWTEYNEVYVPGYQPVRTVYRQNSRDVVAGRNRRFRNARHSCLAAGTPIWTESGPVPIERVQVGDRVLSQHAETGQLAYKPVLRTTVREPAALVEIQLARESFTCSGGHPFWVCGESWVKARELAPGKLLHRVTGSTAIVSVEPAPAEPVYNLIVADSHTYFVGKAKILSHDITIRRPTDAIVPGLAKR